MATFFDNNFNILLELYQKENQDSPAIRSFFKAMTDQVNYSDNTQILFDICDAFKKKLSKDHFALYSPGILYCLHNIMYTYHGQLYKVGETTSARTILRQFNPNFIESCKVLAKTKQLKDRKMAEAIAYHLLAPHKKPNSNPGFFTCSVEQISAVFQQIETAFDTTVFPPQMKDFIDHFNEERMASIKGFFTGVLQSDAIAQLLQKNGVELQAL